VEDHRILAETLELALVQRGFRCVVAELHSSQSIVDVAARTHPDLVLLDLDLGPIDGLQLVKSLRASGQRVLVVTGCDDTRRLAATIALGAVGWVHKNRPFEEILGAATSACRDRPLLSSDAREVVTNAGRQYVEQEAAVCSRISMLTPRERDVLGCIIRGETAEEMAGRFVISLGTVRTHIRAVLTKLGVSNQVAAAAVAMQWSASRRGFDRDALLAPRRSGV
jgi:DNA-binding NarL/FixJ family response regulator